MDISGKIIVVTGAGSGIGRALVAKFMSLGAKTVVGVDIDEATVNRTAAELDCVAMRADVAAETAAALASWRMSCSMSTELSKTRTLRVVDPARRQRAWSSESEVYTVTLAPRAENQPTVETSASSAERCAPASTPTGAT